MTHHPELGDAAMTANIIPISSGLDPASSLTVSPSTSNLLRETLATRRGMMAGEEGDMSGDKVSAETGDGQAQNGEGRFTALELQYNIYCQAWKEKEKKKSYTDV